MMDDIYNEKILEFAGNISRIGRLDRPDAQGRAHSRICGSTVTVYLKLEDGLVTDFAHEVRACALGQAASSVMARHIIGSSCEELLALQQQMTNMLKAEGDAPQGKWEEYRYFLPVRNYKARHASTLLTFDAIADALDSINKANNANVG